MGKGEFIDYQVLSKYVISMVRNGTSMNGFYLSLSDYCKSEGLSCSIDPGKFLEAVNGFKANLSFDLKEVFQCTNCGVHGQFIVADGMATGPAWWKVKDLNLQELSLPADDKVTQIFEQEDK